MTADAAALAGLDAWVWAISGTRPVAVSMEAAPSGAALVILQLVGPVLLLAARLLALGDRRRQAQVLTLRPHGAILELSLTNDDHGAAPLHSR